MNYFDTHRCEGSLNCNASIRLVQDYGDESPMTWMLFFQDYDFEYLTPYLKRVGEIFYCPWCGKYL